MLHERLIDLVPDHKFSFLYRGAVHSSVLLPLRTFDYVSM